MPSKEGPTRLGFAVRPEILNLPSPALAQSAVSDPDELLTRATRIAVEAVLSRCPIEAVMVVFGTLGPRRSEKTREFLHVVARQIYHRWGLGSGARRDGALYMLALRDRAHHLFVGPRMLYRMGGDERVSVLDAAVPGLRAGNVDAAVLAVAKRIVWEARFGWWLRRAGHALVAYAAAAWMVFMMYRSVKDWRASRRKRERERREREGRLQQAWRQISHAGGEVSQLCAPCAVCIEPLSTAARDWAAELALQRRGFLGVRPDGPAPVALLARLPPPLQRHVLSFMGPALTDFMEEQRRSGRACADGIELFRCSHALHKQCADRWLQRRNSCPHCRLENPRIAALSAVPAAFAAAHMARRYNVGAWASDLLVDSTVHDVAAELSRPAPGTYEHHQDTPSSTSTWGSLVGGGGGGGGAGTTGTW